MLHLLCDDAAVHIIFAQSVAQLLDTRSDLVEVDLLLPTISLDDEHVTNFSGSGEECVVVSDVCVSKFLE